MSKNMDNINKSLTIEIEVEISTNIIISCIFIEHLERVSRYLMMNLLECFSTMYNHTLFPVIVKPTSITTESAMLIDNIFTNNIEIEILNGLMINDISDHVSIFAV